MYSNCGQYERRSLRRAARRFASNEDGAITIDWVALTAGMLLLGITLVYAIFTFGVGSTSGSINSNLSAITIVDPGPAPGQDAFGDTPTRDAGGAPDGDPGGFVGGN